MDLAAWLLKFILKEKLPGVDQGKSLIGMNIKDRINGRQCEYKNLGILL